MHYWHHFWVLSRNIGGFFIKPVGKSLIHGQVTQYGDLLAKNFNHSARFWMIISVLLFCTKFWCGGCSGPLLYSSTGWYRGKWYGSARIICVRKFPGPNKLDGNILKELLIGQGAFFGGPLLFVFHIPITSFVVKYILICCSQTESPKENLTPPFSMSHPILHPLM